MSFTSNQNRSVYEFIIIINTKACTARGEKDRRNEVKVLQQLTGVRSKYQPAKSATKIKVMHDSRASDIDVAKTQTRKYGSQKSRTHEGTSP